MDAQHMPVTPATPEDVSTPLMQSEIPHVALVNLLPVKKPQGHPVFWWIVGIVFFIILTVVSVYFLYPREVVVISYQNPGRIVHVDRVLMTRPGNLIVFYVSTEGIDEIADTPLLDPEDYREFDVPLKPDMPDLASGDQLSGVLYEDTDSNLIINTRVDKPIRDLLGRQIRVSFSVQ